MGEGEQTEKNNTIESSSKCHKTKEDYQTVLNRIVIISLSEGYILRLNCTLYYERRVMTAL